MSYEIKKEKWKNNHVYFYISIYIIIGETERNSN